MVQANEAYFQTRDAVHAAATATESRGLFIAPFKCKVLKVEYASDAAVTGDTTNRTNLNLINVGAAGVGTTEVGNLDFITGVDAVAFDVKNIPFNATYLTDGVDMIAGDVLTIQYEKVGTGVLVGPGLFSIKYIAT